MNGFVLVDYKLEFASQRGVDIKLFKQRGVVMGRPFYNSIGTILTTLSIKISVKLIRKGTDNVIYIHRIDECIYISIEKLSTEFGIRIESVREAVDVDGCHGGW